MKVGVREGQRTTPLDNVAVYVFGVASVSEVVNNRVHRRKAGILAPRKEYVAAYNNYPLNHPSRFVSCFVVDGQVVFFLPVWPQYSAFYCSSRVVESCWFVWVGRGT
jgi:hypothetical protein